MQCAMARAFHICTVLVAILTGQPGTCSPVGTHVSLATFNTGLTPRVDEYATRRKWIAPKLRELEANVVCLQEVWYSSDMEYILSDIGQNYPYSYSDLHDSVGTLQHVGSQDSPCATASFENHFLPCLISKCKSASGQNGLLSCARNQCDLMSLEQQCITCLVLSDHRTAIQRCYLNKGYRFNVPGLLLLSNLPILSVNVSRFVPEKNLLLPRAYISAQIEGVGMVACTHTTANLGPTYFEVLNYTSWEEQNLYEAAIIIQAFSRSPHAVVMGDLNSSPEIENTNIEADFPAHYSLFINQGYRGYFADGVGICTWCPYNKLAKTEQHLLLDHVLLKNHTHVGLMRIFDENIEEGDYPLSDHYGILVMVNRVNMYI